MDIALFCICSNSCVKYLGKLKWKDSTVQHNTLYNFFFLTYLCDLLQNFLNYYSQGIFPTWLKELRTGNKQQIFHIRLVLQIIHFRIFFFILKFLCFFSKWGEGSQPSDKIIIFTKKNGLIWMFRILCQIRVNGVSAVHIAE